MAQRSPMAGQGLLAALESQQRCPTCLAEMGRATRTPGEHIKKGHIFASNSSPTNTPQLGFRNTKMIQCQGTSACFVGATPHVSVDRIGRLHPLPHGSKLGALQKRVPGPIALPQEEMATEKPVTPTEEQLEILEYNFCKVNKHPDPTTLCLIAAETGLSEEQTLKWFKQRLAEWRKSEGLPSESGSVRD
ncbi:homeodomain-only protein isoform X1 [Phalacrocorax aristotelis]|uniref:homeodomain-only protein isoform X1 n=1 Tax=Phalacrocorax aristotelis TaxID=126867 RepID=UPI003F4B4088